MLNLASLLLLLALTTLSAVVPFVRTTSIIQCERITVKACQGFGYNLTAMPNLAGHQSQSEAEFLVRV